MPSADLKYLEPGAHGCASRRPGTASHGSNPTPATPCEYGPLAGISRLGGPFSLSRGVSPYFTGTEDRDAIGIIAAGGKVVAFHEYVLPAAEPGGTTDRAGERCV